MYRLRSFAAPLGLAIVVAVLIAAQCVAWATTNYFFAADATQPASTLGTYAVVDTGQTSGPYKIFQVINNSQPTGTTTYINGTGPNGAGHYAMVILPGGDDELLDIKFYVSGL